MQPIACHLCGTTVLVEKYSVEHTSVQWLDDAATVCPRMRGTAKACPALRAMIDRAVVEGTLRVTHRTEPTPGRLT